ncbi:MAG: carboxypeptidase-like regulatory domain-containing protein, partial [Flavobacteriaceae bacterium]|nr:carboxypeptidase-like regulatory domain-containing protein [Flavobacteriaceae bacterium]
MNLKNKLTIIVILLFNISLFAQNSFLLKGNVVAQNDNSPIPGVSIIIKDTSKGTSTDFDGNFQLEVKTGDILQISFIGYMIQTITIKGQTVLKVVLTEDTQSLDEVVVIGYGTQKKSHLTGSISKVV